MFTAWSVINAQILPESRGFQFNFKSQKAQSSCRSVRRSRIWAILCYPTKIMKGEFISCVYLSKWKLSWQHPSCFHEQRNSQVHFQVPSLGQPCPMQQDQPLKGWWHWPSLPCSIPPAQVVALNTNILNTYTNSFVQSRQEYFPPKGHILPHWKCSNCIFSK